MEGMILALRATKDQNASLWRIAGVLDAYTAELDPFGFPPLGWSDETEIPGRVLDAGLRLLNGAYVQMEPPGGNNRIRITVNLSNYAEVRAAPRAGLGDATLTSPIYMYDDDDVNIILHGYFAENDALFYKFADYDDRLDVVLCGELDEAASEDTWPGFVFGTNNTVYPGQPHNFTGRMLGASSADIQMYASWMDRGWNSNEPGNFELKEWWRDINAQLDGDQGRSMLRAPWVVLDDVASNGGFVRGKLPVIRFGPQNGWWAPIGAKGDWWHLKQGLFVPKNGPNDPELLGHT
jgi:hypothetical protein